MLSNTGISKFFWAEALAYACHLVNRLLSSAIGGKTPLEVWSEKVAQDYDSLRYLKVRPTIISRKTSWTQGQEKVCS